MNEVMIQNDKYLEDNPLSVIELNPPKAPIDRRYQELIVGLEKHISSLPNAVFGDFFPLKHSFAEGVYIRELKIPAGMFCVGKLHRDSYVNFFVSGDMTVMTEKGARRVQGPCTMTSPPGTKRFGFSHTDVTWVTVHPNPTNTTDIEALEKQIHLDSYDLLGAPHIIDVDAVFIDFVKDIWSADEFRLLTKEIYAHEKPGFWSDWTEEQQKIYMSGDWEAFSKSRGYSDEEIETLRRWITMKELGEKQGLNPLEIIHDLSIEVTAKNIKLDKKGEILKSSHIPSSKKMAYK